MLEKPEDEGLPLPRMNLKNFPTKAYSFGVSRIDAKKVHVGKVYRMAELGLANPGPGDYEQKAPIGLDTPKYSMSGKTKQVDRKSKKTSLSNKF